MRVRIAVIAEAEDDRRIACDLIDRKLAHHLPAALQGRRLEELREYCGVAEGSTWTRWSALHNLDHPRILIRRGAILEDEPVDIHGYDYFGACKALIHCNLAKPKPDVVVLVRDMDAAKGKRAESLRAAQEWGEGAGLKVVLGIEDQKREAWVLAGWTAQDRKERDRHAEEKKKLKFDPCAEPHRLREPGEARDRAAKRVLKALTDGDRDREAACWLEADWETLRTRGKECGLAAFLEEVKARLVPMITGSGAGAR